MAYSYLWFDVLLSSTFPIGTYSIAV